MALLFNGTVILSEEKDLIRSLKGEILLAD